MEKQTQRSWNKTNRVRALELVRNAKDGQGGRRAADEPRSYRRSRNENWQLTGSHRLRRRNPDIPISTLRHGHGTIRFGCAGRDVKAPAPSYRPVYSRCKVRTLKYISVKSGRFVYRSDAPPALKISKQS
ncbi:hypothetical protein EVAR_88158_1 [Eumeta japonica]|uniref:Uncharacterized protein n=1 Tax=Eumeta variegata TaxID=151549 RepID=A0A4C1WEZ3_EUMVA|nr:hypothetical protein EVAR_88158_1 [Eumeta japonica]